MRLSALLLAGLWVAGGQAHAGLFSDDEARTHAQQLDVRTSKLEGASKQQVEINEQQATINKQQAEINKQQTHSMLDLQTQIEAQNTELRRLRGQNEELVHKLQDAEKRQKDFYIDLDARIRHFESIEAATPPAPPVAPVAPPPASMCSSTAIGSVLTKGLSTMTKRQPGLGARRAGLRGPPSSTASSDSREIHGGGRLWPSGSWRTMISP